MDRETADLLTRLIAKGSDPHQVISKPTCNEILANWLVRNNHFELVDIESTVHDISRASVSSGLSVLIASKQKTVPIQITQMFTLRKTCFLTFDSLSSFFRFLISVHGSELDVRLSSALVDHLIQSSDLVFQTQRLYSFGVDVLQYVPADMRSRFCDHFLFREFSFPDWKGVLVRKSEEKLKDPAKRFKSYLEALLDDPTKLDDYVLASFIRSSKNVYDRKVRFDLEEAEQREELKARKNAKLASDADGNSLKTSQQKLDGGAGGDEHKKFHDDGDDGADAVDDDGDEDEEEENEETSERGEVNDEHADRCVESSSARIADSPAVASGRKGRDLYEDTADFLVEKLLMKLPLSTMTKAKMQVCASAKVRLRDASFSRLLFLQTLSVACMWCCPSLVDDRDLLLAVDSDDEYRSLLLLCSSVRRVDYLVETSEFCRITPSTIDVWKQVIASLPQGQVIPLCRIIAARKSEYESVIGPLLDSFVVYDESAAASFFRILKENGVLHLATVLANTCRDMLLMPRPVPSFSRQEIDTVLRDGSCIQLHDWLQKYDRYASSTQRRMFLLGLVASKTPAELSALEISPSLYRAFKKLCSSKHKNSWSMLSKLPFPLRFKKASVLLVLRNEHFESRLEILTFMIKSSFALKQQKVSALFWKPESQHSLLSILHSTPTDSATEIGYFASRLMLSLPPKSPAAKKGMSLDALLFRHSGFADGCFDHAVEHHSVPVGFPVLPETLKVLGLCKKGFDVTQARQSSADVQAFVLHHMSPLPTEQEFHSICENLHDPIAVDMIVRHADADRARWIAEYLTKRLLSLADCAKPLDDVSRLLLEAFCRYRLSSKPAASIFNALLILGPRFDISLYSFVEAIFRKEDVRVSEDLVSLFFSSSFTSNSSLVHSMEACTALILHRGKLAVGHSVLLVSYLRKLAQCLLSEVSFQTMQQSSQFVRLSDSLRSLASQLRKSVLYVIPAVVDALKQSPFREGDVKREFMRGVWALMDTCGTDEFQEVNTLITDAAGRELWRQLYAQYDRLHRFKGKS
eukprot:ANDGO_04432.mRNA.1 hypothetical protein